MYLFHCTKAITFTKGYILNIECDDSCQRIFLTANIQIALVQTQFHQKIQYNTNLKPKFNWLSLLNKRHLLGYEKYKRMIFKNYINSVPKTQNFNISKHWLSWWFDILITDVFIKHQNCFTYFKLLLWCLLFKWSFSTAEESRCWRQTSWQVPWVLWFCCCVVPNKRKFERPKEITTNE